MTPPIVPHRSKPHQGRRLLLISPYPPSRTGPAEYASVFAAQCAARGFEVRVLAEDVEGVRGGAVPPAGVTIDPVWTSTPAGIARLSRAARGDLAEVVHVNYSFTMYGGGPTGLLALFEFARLARRHPLVVTLFDVLPKRDLTTETLALYHIRSPPVVARGAVQIVLRLLARIADRIVVQTESTRRILTEDYGVAARKVVITELPGYPTPRPASQASWVRGAPPTILYYGFLAPYKGVEALLEAFARARASHPATRFRLVIAGANHPRLTDDYAAAVRARATELGLGGSDVEFTGYVPESEAPRLFVQSALVVLPYLRTTGASGTLATAMGLERPVLVSDLPPLVGQLNGYALSRLVTPGDVGSLADVIGQVAEGRFAPRPPTAAPGAVRRWEDLVDRTAEIYSSAIAEHGTALAGAGRS